MLILLIFFLVLPNLFRRFIHHLLVLRIVYFSKRFLNESIFQFCLSLIFNVLL
jgi:hypothetical protein